MARRALLVLVAVLVLLPGGGTALAAPSAPTSSPPTDGPREATAEEYGLAATVGHDGRTRRGAWTPVEVTVAPPRPVAATLVVESRTDFGTRLRHEQEVEVAGGASNAYRFVVPGGAVRVLLVEGDAVAAVTPAVRDLPGPYLVGRLDTAPPTATLPAGPSGRQGEWVGVDAAWLDESMALDPLAALVADASALAALGEDARTNLATAVAAGLQLVVVADRDGPVVAPGLATATRVVAVPGDGGRRLDVRGAAWRRGGDGSVTAAAADHGLGRVVWTAVDPAAGDATARTGLVGPGDAGAPQEWDLRSSAYQLGRVVADPDATVPTIPWLAAYLAVYILVVGPLNGLVLQRLRRRELAWVTVPLVTAVFTATAFVGVSGSRPAVGQVARAVWSLDGSAEEVLVVALRSPRAATRAATVPGEDWAVDVVLDGGSTSAATVAPGRGGVRASLRLSGLQLGAVLARRPSAEVPPLRVAATAGADDLTVVVTNTAAVPLDDVVVRAATTSRRIGAMAPGEERSVEIGADVRPADPYRDLMDGIEGANGVGGLPASLEAVLRGSVLDGDPGVVWAVGTTPTSSTDVTVDGEQAQERGTLFAVGARPTLAAAGTVPAQAVARDLVSNDADYRPGPHAVEGGSEAVLRYRLPAGARPGELTHDLRRDIGFGGAATLEVWDVPDGTWVALADGFPARVGDPARLVGPLGEVHVRATGELFPFEYAGRTVTARPGGGSP